MKIRLQKFLAEAGVASRRKAEMLIVQGRVKVNGNVITALGTKVDSNDEISLNNKIVQLKIEKSYIILNKPVGYLTTVKKSKEKGKIITDLVKSKQRLFPVGRLDRDTSGLLILTNDGDLALKLTHPRYEKEKEYLVEIDRNLEDKDIDELRRGVKIDSYTTLPTKVKKINNTSFSIILKEGKNRQIRKMCQRLGYKVVNLQRIRIKNLTIENLKLGEWRHLTQKEVQQLKK